MRIPEYDDLDGGAGGFSGEEPLIFGGFDFLMGNSWSARTRLPNGKWLRVWFAMDRGKPWRLVGNFDRKAELRLSVTDEATDEPNAETVTLPLPDKMTDTAQIANTDLANLIPYVDAAIGAIVASSKLNRVAAQERDGARQTEADAKAVAALAELRRRGL